jgi:glycosyltransferase involved in cell wall biosynthesis
VQRHGRHRILTDRVLFRRADAVITLNGAQETFLREAIHVPASKLHRVPNGIDTDFFAAPSGAGPGEAVALRDVAGPAGATGSGRDERPQSGARRPHSAVCVASLTDVKNHAGLLRAWASVVRALPDAHLTLVGDGELRTRLEEQVDSLALSGRVAFAGLQEDVRPFLWRAPVFVLPSHSEALPLSLLEAMAAGCAPVATAVGGIVDVIEDGASGRLVRPGDEEALGRALLDCLRDERRCAGMAAQARETVARRFGLGAWLERIEWIYMERLDRRRPRPRNADGSDVSA